MNYVPLTIGEREFKLRLDTKNTVALEKVIGTNPVNELGKCANGQLPTENFIIATLHASMQKYHHGMTVVKIYDLIDQYKEEGKNSTDLIPVLLEVFQVSGIIPKDDAEDEENDPE